MEHHAQLSRALDELVTNCSPCGWLAGLTADEQRMLRFAQLLCGLRLTRPAPGFVSHLRNRLAQISD